jgi:hypothetical protein
VVVAGAERSYRFFQARKAKLVGYDERSGLILALATIY